MALRAAARLGSCSHLNWRPLPQMAQRRFVHLPMHDRMPRTSGMVYSHLWMVLNGPGLHQKNAREKIFTAMRNDRCVRYEDFEGGSPLHAILTTYMNPGVKPVAIDALVLLGVNANHRNDKRLTPLDLVKKHSCNNEERAEIEKVLKQHWGVCGLDSTLRYRVTTKTLAVLRTLSLYVATSPRTGRIIHGWVSRPIRPAQ